MANEIKITLGVLAKKGNLDYRLESTAFTETIDAASPKGPCPGAITVTTSGTDADFSQLTNPGLCVMKNLDEDNYVTYGIYDTSTATFFPLGEILPGSTTQLRLSRGLGGEGVGTTGANTLRFVADTASCFVQVLAFES